MSTKFFTHLLILAILLVVTFGCDSVVYETKVQLLTYDFSDPNPIPEFGQIYPYPQFETFATEGVMKEWTMVIMENKYIKLWIAPEIGGKVWGATEKSTGKEFIFFNDVVKFRDVEMRGAWTSGGLEINFGVLGHNPTCATPVDYYFRENDGSDSVSCFVSAVDFSSNTRWVVEYRLGEEDAFFTTRSTWQNRDNLPQSYYFFDQANPQSSQTSFKSRTFYPGHADTFIEYWLPVVETGGLTHATADASFYLNSIPDGYEMILSPNREFEDFLNIYKDDSLVFSTFLKAEPLEKQTFIFPTKFDKRELSFYLGNRLLYEGNEQNKKLDRPVEIPSDYSSNTSEALALEGNKWLRQRHYTQAQESFGKSLAINPYQIEALVGMGEIAVKEFRYETALDYVKKVLSIDTYHPEANLLYGLISHKLGNFANSIDGYSIASAHPLTRGSAFSALAEIYIAKKDFENAFQYILRAKRVGVSTDEIVAMEAIVLFYLDEIMDVDDDPYEDFGLEIDAKDFLEDALYVDPLNFLLLAEKALRKDEKKSYEKWISKMRSEFPYQTQLDCFFFYQRLGLNQELNKLLSYAQPNPFSSILKAYINGKDSSIINLKSIKELEIADSINPTGFFSYREEMIKPLKWAIKTNPFSWKFKWYLGLIYQNVRQLDKAIALYEEALALDTISFYPFYINYYSLDSTQSSLNEKEIERILALSESWICDLEVAKLVRKNDNLVLAKEIIVNALANYPKNNSLSLEYLSILQESGDSYESVIVDQEF